MPDQFPKLFLASLIGILAALFFVVLLVAVIRGLRAYRKRSGIGHKKEKTEYIDAWSQYRLDDDDIDDLEVDDYEKW